MTHLSKVLLRNSIQVFNSSNTKDKEEMIRKVESSLNAHHKALDSIGFGSANDFVVAGEIFLRIYGNNPSFFDTEIQEFETENHESLVKGWLDKNNNVSSYRQYVLNKYKNHNL